MQPLSGSRTRMSGGEMDFEVPRQIILMKLKFSQISHKNIFKGSEINSSNLVITVM